VWHAFGDGGATVIVGGERRRFASGEAIEGIPAPDPDRAAASDTE
jgi:hypothetical protein